MNIVDVDNISIIYELNRKQPMIDDNNNNDNDNEDNDNDNDDNNDDDDDNITMMNNFMRCHNYAFCLA
jgi:hypothetical protein